MIDSKDQTKNHRSSRIGISGLESEIFETGRRKDELRCAVVMIQLNVL